jgi:hypothetical protein
LCCPKPRAFHFEDAAADMKIALGTQLDPGLAKFLLDGKIEIVR